MKSTEQTPGQNVYQHGKSVQNYLFDLINHLRSNTELKYKWNIPQCLYDNKDYILSNLLDDDTLKQYTLFHDIGKPFCKTTDENGKIHFPNHARVSYEIFNQVFPGNLDAAYLILHDMDLHTIKSVDVDAWIVENKKYVMSLLLTTLSEIHSNCQMFGGHESTSYKIKLKSITQRAKQIFSILTTTK